MVQASLQQNRGNSGGPVLKDDVVVGISFQGMQTGDRINYFIPINLVKALLPLMDKQEQIPRWRSQIQFMFPRLKRSYHLRADQRGSAAGLPTFPAAVPMNSGSTRMTFWWRSRGTKLTTSVKSSFSHLARRFPSARSSTARRWTILWP